MKKGKVFKIIKIPITLVILISFIFLPHLLYSLINTKYSTEKWAAFYSSKSKMDKPYCKVKDGFETEDECKKWRKQKVAELGGNGANVHKCAKGCTYDKSCKVSCPDIKPFTER